MFLSVIIVNVIDDKVEVVKVEVVRMSCDNLDFMMWEISNNFIIIP